MVGESGISLESLASLERAISTGPIDHARDLLRRILLGVSAIDQGSIGDALQEITAHSKDQLVAILILRSLDVPGLIPEPNSTNRIIRSTVELCEALLPEIVRFLKIPAKAQNIEKFEALSLCHRRISEILSPLRSKFGDLDALLNARKETLGGLNHSMVRLYASPYLLNDVRRTIETILGKLKRVFDTNTSLLVDVEDARRSIERAKEEARAISNFLTNDFLVPYLDSAESALLAFVNTLRGRFASAITFGRDDKFQLQKRYPLHESGREIQISVPLRNSGPGMATDLEVSVSLSTEAIVLAGSTISPGNVLPGDFSVVLDILVIEATKQFSILLELRWGEIGNPVRKSEIFEVEVVAQEAAIDWQSLEYMTPYSTDVARGKQFVGRHDSVRHLAAMLLRQQMQSFYITGQKRVGKTSLALAAIEFAKNNSSHSMIESHYILWGSVAAADPIESLKRLGESIDSFIQRKLPEHVVGPRGNYIGSLADLVRLADFAEQIDQTRKFVVVIDEFDEIHQELFVQGNLAETFFANLRALSRCRNICIALVGGENMPFVMDRQGQKLNNFSRVNLSYFSRAGEWSDFQLLVRSPTSGILNWHDDAVTEIFNVTNGNPYFANIVCAGVMKLAVLARDADITLNEVTRAIESEISGFGAHSFCHLWQDGVPKPIDEREPDILRRMRVLVALARCLRHAQQPILERIAASKTSALLADAEIQAVLLDFVRRGVLTEVSQVFGFALPIFRLWLTDVGVSQLFADALHEELANNVLSEENKALIKSEEVAALAESWPTYRGMHIGTDEIRAWYQQVESLRDQRVLFELLKRTKVFSEAHIRERLRNAHDFIRASLPEFIIRRRSDRRKDVLVTYIDGEGKSGASYASTYAEENRISADCVCSRSNFRERFKKSVEAGDNPVAVVVIDDIAATGRSLAGYASAFFDVEKDLLSGVKVRILTLVATEAAQSKLLAKLAKIGDIDIDFRSCEILPPESYAFPDDASVWRSEEEAARAKALCLDLGVRIYPNAPLGYGDLALLVVFPTTVPNNSLPILHSESRTSSANRWKPLFLRVTN